MVSDMDLPHERWTAWWVLSRMHGLPSCKPASQLSMAHPSVGLRDTPHHTSPFFIPLYHLIMTNSSQWKDPSIFHRSTIYFYGPSKSHGYICECHNQVGYCIYIHIYYIYAIPIYHIYDIYIYIYIIYIYIYISYIII